LSAFEFFSTLEKYNTRDVRLPVPLIDAAILVR
jgi:hypothetical protein